MDNSLLKIINNNNCFIDDQGILIADIESTNEVLASKKAWEKIYDFDVEKLKKDREDFNNNKLQDHLGYIKKYYKFNKDTIYLEIGCGPAYIGEYIMKNHDSYFIGVDFNYNILLSLKQYFNEKGYKKYLLIHGDINKIPIKNDSIDFIYGGGVIEHFYDTNNILFELHRVLKVGGISFNTVPSFNFYWLLMSFSIIPSPYFLRKIFEFVHIKLLKNKVLDKTGYGLSFTRSLLIKLHMQSGFKNIIVEPFAFHPSFYKLRSKFLRELYFKITQNSLFSAFYLVCGTK